MMKTSKRANPLNHRFLRELKDDFGKYLVIFLLMVMSIAEVSGFLVADESMIKTYNDSFQKYNIEDGHFETEKELSTKQTDRIEENGITLYPDEFVEASVNGGDTLRIFRIRKEVDRVDVMQGELPDETGEIAIDRMYAKNNGIQIGDLLKRGSGKRSWTVTGYVALSDYSALFENNNDSMFDAVGFGVAVVSDEEFSTFSSGGIHHNYAWLYNTKPSDKAEEKDRAEDLMKKINAVTALVTFIPRYANQAINFTGDDMGGDRSMMMVLLYMIIAILGFVFAVTISNTIRKESSVIGTLRASGYTRGELVRHYMVMPLIVTLISAVVGNVFGYTVMKNVNARLYYASYSLPSYKTIWSLDALVETTLIPIALMVVITFLMLNRALKVPPLNFLRGELRRKGRSKAVRLSHSLAIFTRYRIRVLFQNLPNYGILFLGILFADVLLMFGLALPLTLTHYQESLSDNLISNYQYILAVPSSMERDEDDTNIIGSMIDTARFYFGVQTQESDAEEFSVNTLKTTGENGRIVEDVTLYGVKNNSKYVHLSMNSGDVYVSQAYADKYSLKPGDEITLKEEYEDRTYSFKITGIYDYRGSLSVFMPMDDLNKIFDYGNGFFAGYFSNTKLSDLDADFVGTVIDLESLTKISRQLDVSMGKLMYFVDTFAVIMFMILVYLLTKTIIEKNASSISMAKILGYTGSEISRLYLLPTTLAVMALLIVSIPIVQIILSLVYNAYLLAKMPGYMPIYIDMALYLKMFSLGLGVYIVVLIFEMHKIRRVPMDIALKTME